MTHHERLAYCAGLLDGEGCITIRRWSAHTARRDYLRHELHVEIKQVRPEAVTFCQQVFGGRLAFKRRSGKQRKYSGEWLWSIDSTRGADILRTLRPFLFLKGAEADVAMAFQALKLKRDSGRSFKLGLTNAEVVERDRLRDELVRLKRLHNNPAVQADYASRPNVSVPVRA